MNFCRAKFLTYHFSPVIHSTKTSGSLKGAEPRGQTAAPISLTLTPAVEQPHRHQSRKKGSTPKAEESDTDQETPIAQQMLSFIMDDPEFESEASDTPKIAKVNYYNFTETERSLVCKIRTYYVLVAGICPVHMMKCV